MRNLLIIPALAALLFACQPQIGDSCISDTECQRGQTCDTASPAGYCLRYGCEQNECTDEAVCVEFEADGAILVSACMLRCSSNGDCRTRDGYVCRRDVGPVPFCGVPAAVVAGD